MDEELKFILLALAVSTIITISSVFGLVSIINYAALKSCYSVQENTGVETKFNGPPLSKICYVQINNKWIPYEKWWNEQE